MAGHETQPIVFFVPEGLEWIAESDIVDALAVKPVQHYTEPRTGRVTLEYKSSELVETMAMIRRTPFLTVYSVVLVTNEATFPPEVYADSDATCQFIRETTLQAHWSPIVDATPDVATFRATFYKGHLKHKVRSQLMAGYVGQALGELYPSWKVDLERFDREAVAFLRPTEEGVRLVIGLTLSLDQLDRKPKHFGRTTLNACIASCLAKVAAPQPGQVVLDMCCGTAAIPMEGALRYPEAFWIGSEVHPRTVCVMGRENIIHAGLSNVDLLLGDARRLIMRDACVDIVLSDWPWGVREGSYAQIQKLYPKFMREMGRVLVPNGKAHIVTQGRKLFHRVLAYDWCKATWTMDDEKTIWIGGMEVFLFTLTKKSNV